MAIILDLILLTLTVFVTAYIGAYFLPLNLPLRLVLSALISIVAVSAIRRAFFKPRNNKMSYRKYVTYLIWQGEDYTKDIIAKLCENKKNFEDMGEYIIIDNTPVFLWTKYGSISADTMVRYYRICKKNNLQKAYVLTTNGDKKTTAFIKNFGDVMLIYSNFRQIYNAVRKNDLLPQDSKTKVPAKQMLSMIIQTALTRKNGFRFIGVSLLLLLISFVTPFANYYIAIASINLALAIACMVVSLKNS
ncbi:MAG: hypothetical protein K2K85_03275 [Clostridia bacterium]|nr:hypothetical protein [Clostridia bacterium]